MLKIASAEPIIVEIDDVRVLFAGDPNEAALLALFSAQERFVGADIKAQIGGVGVLRQALRGLLLEQSTAAWDLLHQDSKLTMAVVLQIFEHIVAGYGASLGFRGGSPSPSGSGRPENVPTSEA